MAAKKFRAGRISLDEFTAEVFATVQADDAPSESSPAEPPAETAAGDQNAVGAQGMLDRSAEEHAGSETGVDRAWFAVPERAAAAHKGDMGRVLVIGGSVGMAGAVGLTSQAALRSGAGLVIAMTPESIQPQVAGYHPCVMVLPAPASRGAFGKSALDDLLAQCDWADVIAIGPGMGRTRAGQKIMQTLYRDLNQPMVVDADGLNNLSDLGIDWADHAGMRVLTPHPGEFRRIVGSVAADRASMEIEAIELAATCELTLLLKGHRTMVTDGTDVYRNTTGNAGMATAGAGDVLTGVIAALIGQGLSPRDAAVTGAFVHGLAGDLAADQLGQTSLVATDLLDHLPPAFVQLTL